MTLKYEAEWENNNVTAELRRALAVVKVTLQVNGNSQLFGVRPK